MANKKISELPYINGGKISGNTLVPLVTYFSASTGDTVHTYIDDLQTYLLSGVTSSNFANTDLTFTGDRTHTIGTSNYLYITNDPTFSTVSSFLYLAPNETQIGNYDISNPLYLGFSGNTAYFYSGSKLFSITNNSPINYVTVNESNTSNTFFTVKSGSDDYLISSDPVNDRIGIGTNSPSEKLEVSGNTKITGSLNIGVVGSTTPVSNLGIDINGNVVTGSSDFNTFTTGFTYSNNTFTISDNSGSTFDATFTDVTGLTVNGDLKVTGTTYSNVVSAATYQNLPDDVTGNYLPLSGGTVSGQTFFKSGVTITGDTIIVDYSGNIAVDTTNRTLNDSGGNIVVDWINLELIDSNNVSLNWSSRVLSDTNGAPSVEWENRKLYKSGGTISFDWENGILTGQTNIGSSTISATTYQNLPTDVFVTGGTYSAGAITITNNTGGTFNITGLTTSQNLSKILFVDPNGNDSTAIKGNSSLPYLTLEAAKSAATTGDTIYVFPGTYTVTTTATEGLAKDGIIYYFTPGCTVNKSTAGDMFRVNAFTTGFSVLGYGNFNKTGTAASIFYSTTVASTVNIVFEGNDLTTTTSSVIFDIRSTNKCYLNFRNASSNAGSVINLDASIVSIEMHSMTTTTSYVFIGSAGGQANHFYGCNLTIRGYLIETTSAVAGVHSMLIGGNNLVNLTVNYIKSSTSTAGYGISSNAAVLTRINLNTTRISGIQGTNNTPIAATFYLDGFTDGIYGKLNLIGGETNVVNISDGEINTTFRGYYDNSTSGTITVSGGVIVLNMENQDPTTGFNISGGDVTLNGTWTNDDMSAPADLTGGILRMNCDYEYGGPNYAQTRYYGLRVNGGTLILKGTIRVNFPASLGLNSYNSLQASPIVFNSGKIIINGGTLISNISGATAIQTTSSGLSIKVYSGGLNTNLNQNGGVLSGKKMRIKYTVNSVATTSIVLNDGTGGNETFTETDTTTYNTTALLAQRMVSLINASGTLDITASQDTSGSDTYFYAESDTANNQYSLVSTTNLTVFAISPGMYALTQSVLGPIIEDTDIE